MTKEPFGPEWYERGCEDILRVLVEIRDEVEGIRKVAHSARDHLKAIREVLEGRGEGR